MRRTIVHAVRRLRRSPGFTVAAFLTLAAGLAAPTAVFGVVHAVLLTPLPYPQPDRIVTTYHTLEVGHPLRVGQSDASLLFYARHTRAFSAFGGYEAGAAAFAPAAGEDAERVTAAHVTSGVFDTLRVAPMRGRLFTGADDRPGSTPVVILSERLWKRRFGADPGVLDRAVAIDGTPHEVVGILPDAVRFPASDTEAWLPLHLDPAHTDSATFDFDAIGRLRDGVSIDQAAADLQALLPRLPDEFPGRLTRGAVEQTHMRAAVAPLESEVVGGVTTLLWVVLGAAGPVLLAACASVTGLFLVRAEGRRRAFAIQRALGAPPATAFVELMSEAAIVAAAAAAAGIATAEAAARLLRSGTVPIDLPRLTEVRIDPVVIAATAVAAAGAALLVAALAAWRSRAMHGVAPLDLVATRPQHRARFLLVGAQVAMATLLVIGCGLMMRSLARLHDVRPGFDPSDALTFRLALPASYGSTHDAVRFYARALQAVSQVAGVRAAGIVSRLPLEERPQTDTAVFVESRPLPAGTLPRIHPVAYVAPGYFAAMEIPIVAGDGLKPIDAQHAELDAIVSRSFAGRYWPGESPIGKRVRILIGGPWYTVVGVAADVHDAALDRPADELIYCPLLPPDADARWAPRDVAFVVRGQGDTAAIAGGVRAAIRRLDPSLPLYRARPMDALVAQAAARRELVLVLVAIASLIALLLAAVGVYSVLAQVVSLRTREIGIRLALGETPASVGLLIARQGVTAAALGIAGGAAGGAALAGVLGALLFDVGPRDPLVLASSCLFVLAVAAAATWIPGRRAAAVDPAIALRAE